MKQIKFSKKTLFGFWVYRMSLAAHKKINGMRNYKVLITDDVKKVMDDLMKLDTYQIVTLGEAIRLKYADMMEPYLRVAAERNKLEATVDMCEGILGIRGLKTRYEKAEKKYRDVSSLLFEQCLGEGAFDGLDWSNVLPDE